MKADDKCNNCYRDFADHNYVAGSIDQYTCPVKQQESVYGYFCGGDPRSFYPDYESCTPEEIANHKAACETAEQLATARDLPCPSGWERLADGTAIHVTRSPFGIGVSTFEEEAFFEPLETSDVDIS